MNYIHKNKDIPDTELANWRPVGSIMCFSTIILSDIYERSYKFCKFAIEIYSFIKKYSTNDAIDSF